MPSPPVASRTTNAGNNRQFRASELVRPVGRSRWGIAAALAGALGAILVVPVLTGHAELGSAMALGFVLTAVPSLPVSFRAAMATISVRAIAVMAGAVVVTLCAARPLLLAVTTVVAAMVGALVGRVGATAGLAVVLTALDARTGTGAGLSSLAPYAIGAAAVPVAWLAWFGCAQTIRVARHRPDTTAAGETGADGGVPYGHTARVGVAVAAAVGLAGLLPADMVGGHWLITSVLLSIQPRQAETGVRLAQRLSGNTVGAVIAAVVLGTHPAVPVVVPVTVLLFLLAVALRPVNYTWWAVTGPPVLLVISEYPELFPWYEGGVRLAMNLVGAAIVLIVVFGLPALNRAGQLAHRRTG